MHEQKEKRLVKSLVLPMALLLVIWVVHLVKSTTDIDFSYWGIFPRKIYGLKGILTAPLIHGDRWHLYNNSLSLLPLSFVCMYFYKKVAIRGFVMIYILTGIAVWLLGNFFDAEPGNFSHIGASGVVYGLVAFVFWNGVFLRDTRSIVLALIVLVLYSGMFEGVLPNQPGISWESHLFGGLAGIFTSYFYKENLLAEMEAERKHTWQDEYNAHSEKTRYFLDRDIFEKTKAERRREQEENQQSGWTSSDTME